MKPTAIVQFAADGEISFFAAGDVRFLVVDERAPNDRVYEITDRETPGTIAAIIGDDEMHNKHDARHAAVAAKVLAYVEGRPRLTVVRDEGT